MENTCALQFYYFQLGERNAMIEKIKIFLRSRRYLKIKPSLGNIFDVSLLECLKEFQRYKRLQIIDGSFNDETYAALGAEMSEIQIRGIQRADSEPNMITWLLNGKKGKPPFALGKTSRFERSNGNPIDERADRDLALLLTQNGIVRAVSTDGRDSHFKLAGKVYTIHIYGDNKGMTSTGLYLPKFFSPPTYEGGDIVTATTEKGEILGMAHVRVSSQAELNKNYNSGKTNDLGSKYIGEIAGVGGDSVCYRHSHLHFYPNAAARSVIKAIKSVGLNDPTIAHTKYLLDVRELLNR